MARRGCMIRAEENKTLRTICVHCKKELTTETQDNLMGKQTMGLLGLENGKRKIFAVCVECFDAGWRPPEFTWS